jgi:hypothetical protein
MIEIQGNCESMIPQIDKARFFAANKLSAYLNRV